MADDPTGVHPDRAGAGGGGDHLAEQPPAPVVEYLCPVCGRVGTPDLIRTLMDPRYAPGRCGSKALGDQRHGNRHLTLLRRDIYEASRVSRTGRVREVRQPTPSHQQEALPDD